ncbi:MAG: PAS domain-containing protein, partial [Planctomycetaceae bacterium]|nr:PAS domain-containing protein [Planctomycetaceae bacterium]
MAQSEVKQLEQKNRRLENELRNTQKELAYWKNGNAEERKLWEANSTSQKQLDQVLSEMPLVLWGIDCGNQITLFQGAGLELLGLGTKSYHGQPLLKVFGEDPALVSAIERAFTGETCKETLTVGDCSLSCHFQPQENAEHDVVGIRGVALVQTPSNAPVFSDVKSDENRPLAPPAKVSPPPEMPVAHCLDCEAPLLEWLMNFPDYVLSVAREGTIRFINRTIPTLTVEQVVGRSIYEFIREDRREEIRASTAHAFATGECVNYEIESNDPDGVTRTYECRLGPFKHEGEVVSVISIAR